MSPHHVNRPPTAIHKRPYLRSLDFSSPQSLFHFRMANGFPTAEVNTQRSYVSRRYYDASCMVSAISRTVIHASLRALRITFAAPVGIELVSDSFADGSIVGCDFTFAARKIETLTFNGSLELTISIGNPHDDQVFVIYVPVEFERERKSSR